MDAYFDGEETFPSKGFATFWRYEQIYDVSNLYTYIYIFLINPLQSSKKIFLFAKNPGS